MKYNFSTRQMVTGQIKAFFESVYNVMFFYIYIYIYLISVAEYYRKTVILLSNPLTLFKMTSSKRSWSVSQKRYMTTSWQATLSDYRRLGSWSMAENTANEKHFLLKKIRAFTLTESLHNSSNNTPCGKKIPPHPTADHIFIQTNTFKRGCRNFRFWAKG